MVAVLRKVVALAHVFSALAAGERFLIVSNMTDQVERVEGRADLILQSGKDDAVTFQFFDDGALLVGPLPRFQKGIERGVVGADVLAGIVTQTLGDDLSVSAQVLNALVDDGDVNAVDGHFSAALVCAGFLDMDLCPRGREINGFSGQDIADWCVIGFVVHARNIVVLAGLFNANGIAVERFIGEKRGDVTEIYDGEVVLAEILVDPGSPANDLLELGHGTDVRVEDDELTCTHCGVEVPEIPCVEQLNQFIAGVITKKPSLLTGSEIRFLRNRAGFSSKQFAEMLGISPEHLSRIENTKESSTMGTPTDRLVRLIAMDGNNGDKVRTFLSRLKKDTTAKRPKNVEFIRNVHKGKDAWTRIQGLVAA